MLTKEQIMAYAKDYGQASRDGNFRVMENWYTEDLTFHNPVFYHKDRETVIKWMEEIHPGVIERVTFPHLAFGEETIHAIAHADLYFTQDRPDWMTGPMNAGDKLRLVLLIVYFIRGNKICAIKDSVHEMIKNPSVLEDFS